MFRNLLSLLVMVAGSTAFASSWTNQQQIYCETDTIYAVTINHYVGPAGGHHWNMAEVIRDGKDVVTSSTSINPFRSTCQTSTTKINGNSGHVNLECELYGKGETPTSTERSTYYVKGSLTFPVNADGDPARVSERGLKLTTTRRTDSRRNLVPMPLSCRLVK